MGWYPSGPVGQPTAGPFANPATRARRGLAGFSLPRFGKPGGSPARPLVWGRGRGTLMNVALFGVAPLALAGIIVAAFVLVAPGKAASLGFQAGPAPSTQQASAGAQPSPSGPSPSSSPSAHKKHPRGASTTTPGAKMPSKTGPSAKAKPTPKPTHKAGGGAVVPHDLGVPNFAGYCQHIGHRTAEVVASNAYGWRCTLYPNLVLRVVTVCAFTYHLSTSQVIDVSTNYFDPNAWQCWRINRDLGVLNFTTYCANAGLGTSKLVADNAYGWQCTSPAAAVDTNAACDANYHVNDAVSRFAVFADPYSWQCWN